MPKFQSSRLNGVAVIANTHTQTHTQTYTHTAELRQYLKKNLFRGDWKIQYLVVNNIVFYYYNFRLSEDDVKRQTTWQPYSCHLTYIISSLYLGRSTDRVIETH